MHGIVCEMPFFSVVIVIGGSSSTHRSLISSLDLKNSFVAMFLQQNRKNVIRKEKIYSISGKKLMVKK